MSKRKVHVWGRYVDNGVYSTKCGLHLLEEDRPRPTPTEDDLAGATCLHCLKSVQNMALHKSEWQSAIARAATEALDHVRLMAARRRRSRS